VWKTPIYEAPFTTGIGFRKHHERRVRASQRFTGPLPALCVVPHGAALPHAPAGALRAHHGPAAVAGFHVDVPRRRGLANLAGLPDLFCALLALGLAAYVTGAFHEDGLADVADGFGGGATREERLEIMKDSRIGAYGTLTLIITILARASLLTALLDLPPLSILILMAGAAAFSRALMVDLLWATRPARPNGLSVMAGQPSRNTTLLALAIGGIGAGAGGTMVLSPEAGVLALIAGGLALAMVRSLAMRKIGGQTGDVCGAGQVMAETAMLAVYAAAVSFT
jgi:adenosylcobinamide-GDP ribazoletransferase